MLSNPPARRVWSAVPVAILAVVAIFHFGTLLAYPPPTCDETTYASTADSVLERGRFGFGIWPAGEPFGRDQNTLMFGRTYILGMSAVFALLRTSLFGARLHAALGWLLASALVYLIGRRFYSQRLGLASAGLFAAHQLAFMTGHTARPDIWLAAGILLVAWLVLRLVTEEPRAGLALIGGFAAFWLLDFHGNGIVFTAAFGLTVALELGLRQKQYGLVAVFAAGMVLGALAWLAIRIPFSESGDFARQVPYAALFLSPSARPAAGAPQTVAPLHRIVLYNLESFPGWFGLIFWRAGGPLSLTQGGLALIGMAAAPFNRSARTPTRALLLITAISLIVFAVLTPLRWIQYGVLWSGLWIVLGVAGLETLWARFAPQRVDPAWLHAGLYGLVLAYLLGSVWLVYRFQGGAFNAAAARIREVVPEGSRVAGDSIWWWALREDHTFITDEYFMRAAEARTQLVRDFYGVSAETPPEEIVQIVQAKVGADVLLIDGALSCKTPAPSAIDDALRAWADQHCTLVENVSGGWSRPEPGGDPGKAWHQLGQVTSIYDCRAP